MHIQVALSWTRDKKNSHLKTDRDLNGWTLAKVLRLLFMGYISVLLSGRHFLWHLGHKLKQAWTHYAKLSLSKFLIHIVEAFANWSICKLYHGLMIECWGENGLSFFRFLLRPFFKMTSRRTSSSSRIWRSPAMSHRRPTEVEAEDRRLT